MEHMACDKTSPRLGWERWWETGEGWCAHEIAELDDVRIRVEEQVLRLDVSVANPQLMYVCEGAGHLIHVQLRSQGERGGSEMILGILDRARQDSEECHVAFFSSLLHGWERGMRDESADLGVEGGHLSLGTRVVLDDAIDRLWDKLQDEIQVDLVQLQGRKMWSELRGISVVPNSVFV
jgi:hypothetical protein